MQWDSAAYLRFKAERTQPSIDLVKRIDLEQPRKLLDVGCGPGNSTQVLADAFPNALRIIGIDSSPEMIEAAKDDHPDMEFRICDALNLPSIGEDGFDVVFSNACIQWVPDHPRLIRDMLALLRPGGMLAVQVPMNYQEPIHRIIGELAASDEWRAELASARIFHTLSQEAYFDILAAEAGQLQMWQITYLHRMPSHEAIMDWYKGTGLRPYLSLLSGERAAAFEQAVLEEVAARYPKQATGKSSSASPASSSPPRPKPDEPPPLPSPSKTAFPIRDEGASGEAPRPIPSST